jgi:hypothetical protein
VVCVAANAPSLAGQAQAVCCHACEYNAVIVMGLRIVLRDQLGQYLVGLNREQ